MRTRGALGLVILWALAFPAQGLAKGKQGRPSWPVPNPTFAQPEFSPKSTLRQISGVFGPRLKWGSARYDHHEGLDFFAQFAPQTYPQGEHPVLVVLPGVISQVLSPSDPERTETGRKVVVTHDLPWTAFGGLPAWGPVKTGYLHLSRIEVQQGQRVAQGQALGSAGASGYTSTVHLHFNAYRVGGREVNVNPARLFSPRRFPRAVAPLVRETLKVRWLERNLAQRSALVRILLPFNAYTLDGFALQVERDASRVISFEQVSAEQRERRDTGDQDLVPGLQIFPLRYNGGGNVDRVNASKVPAGWPMGRYPVEGGQGVRLGFDLLAGDLPPKAKKFKLVVLGVLGERLRVTAKGFEHVVP